MAGIDHEDRHVVTVPRWAMLECHGNPRDAMVLAQITWWFQPSQRDGSPRTSHTVERDGHVWMYVTDAELAEDIGMSDNQVRKARYALRDLGLVEFKAAKVDGSKVTLVRPVNAGSGTTAESVEPQAELPDLLSGQGADSHAGAVPLLNHGEKIGPPCSPPAVLASEPFEAFWAAYPSKVGKGAARRAWVAASRKATAGQIMVALSAYCRSRRVAEGIICNPATWLNQERWNDEPTTGPHVSKSTTSLAAWADRHREHEHRAVGGGR